MARSAGPAQTRLSVTLHSSRCALAEWKPDKLMPWDSRYEHLAPGHPGTQGSARPERAQGPLLSSTIAPGPGLMSPTALRAHTVLVLCHTLSLCFMHETHSALSPTPGDQGSDPHFKGGTTEAQRRPKSPTEGQSRG